MCDSSSDRKLWQILGLRNVARWERVYSDIFLWNGDDYGFEIVDKSNKVLFSINYVPPNKIYVQGIFNDKVRHVGIVDRTIVVIPFVLFTYMRAKLGQFPQHKKIAKITFPLWLYVAITGVVVYLMIAPYYVH